ncbi:MAG: hypothetical protein DSM106950_44915, partial [Stigonema ocellatum SAG 48.90 = DSM 106950]|nr:hypothetical protein [Stigonema ocellatum SAG 48.90 = DSM 106950]
MDNVRIAAKLNDSGDRKAVITFAAHGLNCCGAHMGRGGEQLVEAAHSQDALIVSGGIHHGSVAHNIV